MSVIVDSNVILDVLAIDSSWFEWSSEKLAEFSEQGDLIINPIIYCVFFNTHPVVAQL